MANIVTKAFAAALTRFGYDFNINPKSFYKKNAGAKFSYSLIGTTASYAPWLDDKEFMRVCKIIEGHTLVEFYRVWEIWSLVEEACKLPGKAALLEVGVWRGGTSGVIGKQLELCGSQDTLYAADTFTGVVKSSEKDAFYNDGEHADVDLSSINKLLFKDLGLKNVQLLQGIFPDDTAASLPADIKFRFCHIDVDVYKSAEGVLEWIWDRLLVGGIVVFDDYGLITTPGITEFVNEWKKRNDLLYVYNVNGHAILIKLH